MIEMFSFKELFTPKSDDLKSVEVVQLWYVRWTARYGRFSSDTKEVMEAFTSKDEAIGFANSLKAAFALVKNACDNSVSVSKN